MSGSKKGARVLVTDGTSGAGLAALRALEGAGYVAACADTRRFPLGLRSRFAARQFEVKAESFDDHALGLLKLVETTRPDVLFPLSTCSVAAVARNRDRMSCLLYTSRCV